MSLRRRAAASFFIAIAIVFIASAVLARAFSDEVDRQSQITDRIDPAAEIAGSLQAANARTAAGLAQYVVTGEDDERLLAQTALDQSTALLDSIWPLLAGEPTLQARASTVRRALDAWLTDDVTPILSLMADGRRAAAASMVDAPEFQKRLTELDSANVLLIRAIEDARSQGLNDLRNITRDLGLALAGAALLAVALSVFSLIGLRSWILAPLDRVRSDLREAALLPSHETPIERTGPPEIAEVARDAESLRRSLLREIDAAMAARAALTHDAPVVAALQIAMEQPSASRIADIDVIGTTRPAEGVVAGDWWDAVALPSGGLGLVVADVSGHDLHAGVIAVGLRAVFRAGLLAGLAPNKVMELAAVGLQTGGRHATAFVAVVRPESNLLLWANAGHHPPLISQPDGLVHPCERTGQLLSPLGGEWRTHQSPFQPGDTCLAFTDGLIESRDDQGEELGEAGVIALIEGLEPSIRTDPGELAGRVIGRARHRASTWNADDITVVAFGRFMANRLRDPPSPDRLRNQFHQPTLTRGSDPA